MASSPLTLALLSGQAGGGMSYDPAMLQALPRLQLAQSMMQQGMDTSPASPWQALARVANAGVGNMIFDKATNGLIQAGAQAAGSAAQTLPPGSPLRKALLSSDPLVRTQGLQAYRTGLLQLNEPYTQKAGDTRMEGDQPISTSTAPQSPEGKIAADISNAPSFAPNTPGAPSALASALMKGATDNGIQYQTGQNGITTAQPVGGYAPARASLAGAIAGSESGARYPFENALQNNRPLEIRPDQQIDVNPNRVTPNGTTMPGRFVPSPVPPAPPPVAASAAPPPAAPPAQAPTPAPQSTPQPAAPVQAPASPVVGAPPGNQIRYQGSDPEMARQQHETDLKEVAADRELAVKSQADLGNLQAARDLMQRTQTGWGTETKLEAARIMKAMGVSDDKIKEFTNTNVADTQALSKLFTINSAAAVRTMGAREPGSVISLFRNAYQNLGTDPDAVNLMTNIQVMQHNRDNDLANRKTNYLNESANDFSSGKSYRGLTGFNEGFNKTNSSEMYMHGAEAMSGEKFSPWKNITDHNQQMAIVRLIPDGATFVAPNGKPKVMTPQFRSALEAQISNGQ